MLKSGMLGSEREGYLIRHPHLQQYLTPLPALRSVITPNVGEDAIHHDVSIDASQISLLHVTMLR